MPSGTRAFVIGQLDRAARENPGEWPIATVTAVAAGGGTDLQALVTVDYNGGILGLPHMDFYTPTVGARVALIKLGGVWTVLGRPVGFPA